MAPLARLAAALATRRWLVVVGLSLAASHLLVNGPGYLDYLAGPVRYDAESGRLARSLLRDGRFADPFAPMATGPSAHMMPGHPAIFALIVGVFGEGPAGWAAVNVGGALAMSAWIGLLPLAAARLGWSPLAGVVAGVLAVAADLRHFPEWDAHYTALGLVLALLVSAPLVESVRPSARRAAASGMLWGALLYLNATTLVVWLAWLAVMLVAGRRQGWDTATWAGQAGVVVVPVLLVAPWAARNRLVFEQWIPLRSNLGLELAVSFNDCAHAGLVQNLESGCFARTHPDSGVEQAARLARLGEPRYHAERRAEAIAWIRTHPRKAAALVLRRMALFWLPSPRDALVAEWWQSTPPRRYRVIVIATLLSLVGLWRAASGSRPAWLLLPAILALYPLVYYLLQFEDRYRYPMLWVTLLLAGRAVVPRLLALPVRSH